jgi:hypothetical protein
MADETRQNHIICVIHFPPPNTSALTLNLTGLDRFRQDSCFLTQFCVALHFLRELCQLRWQFASQVSTTVVWCTQLSHFEIGGDKRIYQHLSGQTIPPTFHTAEGLRLRRSRMNRTHAVTRRPSPAIVQLQK